MLKSTFNFRLSVLLLILVTHNFALANVEIVLGSVDLKNNTNLYTNSLPAMNSSEIIISRSQYIISYNKDLRNPNWVAWKLEDKSIGKSGRSTAFTADVELAKYLKSSTQGLKKPVEVSEYAGFCFDRGHQTPSADRSDKIENNKMTFVMSNIVPQTPFLNRMIWEHLEQHMRNVVHTEHKKAYIIAGPIYDQDFGKIGPHQDIQVPSKEFKVIFLVDTNQSAADIGPNTETIAVIMPNTNPDGSQPSITSPCLPIAVVLNTASPTSDWEKYKTTLNEVEKLSGITFFHH
ncbi:MAG: DNA/RNA non-specific endonuclease [Bdellovibrio sp.]|nr:DNA/RNA non-specific endonuclease [Bdellovibrio sp.]